MKLGATLGLPPTFQQVNITKQEFEKNEKIFNEYEKKFAEIINLQDGDKLARDVNGVYYRHEKKEYFVQIRRWWTNQGRQYTFEQLDEDFTKFMKYLDTILNTLEITYEVRYRELAEKLKGLANSLMTGLYSLKNTYPSEISSLTIPFQFRNFHLVDFLIYPILAFASCRETLLKTLN